jgi:hypothetical protein
MWLGSLHMTQVNDFRPRSQSAKQTILMPQPYIKAKVVPVHDMEAYSSRRGAALLILNLNMIEVSGKLHALATLPSDNITSSIH